MNSCLELPVSREDNECEWVNNIRKREYQDDWVVSKKQRTLQRWSEKGGFICGTKMMLDCLSLCLKLFLMWIRRGVGV